ncbi:AAA family ATPase [Achromobacter pulmonis]|uniref:AAA family ATPase n=1 Tax=Achromobacter pulmonis TaxID=1389932 RepID=UPI001F163E96|nr:AAA family ATPase [Achromobacter pulmonis]MCF7771239.1 AAA family ATPase [Achromobacter pulmonis]
MRITNITIENFQGARAVDLELHTPVTLIAGRNGNGKSSIAEAVRLALLGEPERVEYKKEFGALVTEGQRTGAVALQLDGGTVGITLPKGTQSGEALVPKLPALPYVLDPRRFAAAKPDERRTLLFALAGKRISPDDIERRLVARGCHAALVTQIKPILRTGFPAGAEHAKQEATQAKGAWKAATGEQWGSQKAEGWAAEVPAFDQAALVTERGALAAIDAELEQHTKALGALEQKASAYAATRDQHAALQAQGDKLPALRQKLEFDLAEHQNLVEHVAALEAKAGTGPRAGLVHDLATCLSHLWASEASKNVAFGIGLDIKAALAAYERQYGKIGAAGDTEAAAAVPKAIEARDLMARSIENDRRDIATAEAAAALLQKQPTPEAIQNGDVQAARAKVATLRNERKAVDDRVQALINSKQAATSAAERTANAARYHADVLAWLAISDALSPDGIPGELLAEALQPFNAKLAELASLAGWWVPSIAADMDITWGGRPYRLLSESERWRVDTLIGAALAEVSGLRCLILDRFDVLDMVGRADALGLVDALATDGRLETILVLGTLKSAPPPPSEAFTVFWIADGLAGAAAHREAA